MAMSGVVSAWCQCRHVVGRVHRFGEAPRAFMPSLAEDLGARHAHFDTAALYRATVVPDAILAYLERRDEGWTVVVDPAGLADIEKLKDILGHGRWGLLERAVLFRSRARRAAGVPRERRTDATEAIVRCRLTNLFLCRS